MEVFPPMIGAHTIRLHDNKSQVSDLMLPNQTPKIFGNKCRMRTGIDFLYNRILLLRIKGRRSDNDPENFSLAIATFGHKSLRCLPTRRHELGGIRLFQQAHPLSIDRASQFMERG